MADPTSAEILDSMINVDSTTRDAALTEAAFTITAYAESESLITDTDSRRYKLAIAIQARNQILLKRNSRNNDTVVIENVLSEEVKNLVNTEDESKLIDWSSDNPNSDSSFGWSS